MEDTFSIQNLAKQKTSNTLMKLSGQRHFWLFTAVIILLSCSVGSSKQIFSEPPPSYIKDRLQFDPHQILRTLKVEPVTQTIGNTSIWITWSGADFGNCTQGSSCPAPSFSVPDNTTYACSMPDGPGNWDKGKKEFLDPIPIGYEVRAMIVDFVGRLVCDTDQPKTTAIITLNGMFLGLYRLNSTLVCNSCPSCVESDRVLVATGDDLVYNYGSTNTFQVETGSNDMCLTGVSISFIYEPSDIQVTSISPNHGSTGGSNLVYFTGSGFINCSKLQCKFGDSTVQANWLSSTSLSCSAPGGAPGSVQVQATNNGQYFSSNSIYYTYQEPSPNYSNDFVDMVKHYWYALLLALIVIIVTVFGLVFVIIRKKKYSGDMGALTPLLSHSHSMNNSFYSGEHHLIDFRDIQLAERIGRGNFGEVYKGYWNGTVVAVKRTKFPPVATEAEAAEFLADFEREAEIMRTLRHPNVVQFLGICQAGNDICIITEYMQRGSLNKLLHDRSFTMDWELRIKIALDIASGMNYLHKCQPIIIHRDLKSYNLLVDDTFKVKVCDFGLAKHVSAQTTGAMTSCGTPAWTAPEVLRNEHYTEKADIYSFGIVMWELVTREEPHLGVPPFQVVFAVGTQGVRPTIPSSCPTEMARLIQDCWDENPQERPSFDEVLGILRGMKKSGTIN